MTGITYTINMQEDWKRKQGLFLDIKLAKIVNSIDYDNDEDSREIGDITCDENMTNGYRPTKGFFFQQYLKIA